VLHQYFYAQHVIISYSYALYRSCSHVEPSSSSITSLCHKIRVWPTPDNLSHPSRSRSRVGMFRYLFSFRRFCHLTKRTVRVRLAFNLIQLLLKPRNTTKYQSLTNAFFSVSQMILWEFSSLMRSNTGVLCPLQLTDVGHSNHQQLDDDEADARTMFAEQRPTTSRGSKGLTGDVLSKVCICCRPHLQDSDSVSWLEKFYSVDQYHSRPVITIQNQGIHNQQGCLSYQGCRRRVAGFS
jgi:hypothetical protein